MKVLYLFLFIMLLGACTAEEVIQNEPQEAIALNSRSISDAAEIARNAKKMFSADTRSEVENVELSAPIVVSTKAVSRGSDCDTLLYIFNYSCDDGFSVISAAENGVQLLAYVEDGSYSSECEKPIQFEAFMQQAALYVLGQKSNPQISVSPIEPILKTKYETEYKPKDKVEAKITASWGRNYWEGAFCPNGDAGHEAVCIAMILSYYEPIIKVQHATKAYVTPPSNTKVTISKNDWADMKAHNPYGHTSFPNEGTDVLSRLCPISDNAHNLLGLLCRDIGSTILAKYESTGTTTEPINIIDGLWNYLGDFEFGLYGYHMNDVDDTHEYSPYIDDSTIMKVLRNGFMTLHAINNDALEYIWVCDGFMDVDVYGNTYRQVKSNTILPIWELIESHKIGEDLLLHFNWGDYGKCNGYFSNSVYRPQKGLIYDNSHLSTWINEYQFINEIKVASIYYNK